MKYEFTAPGTPQQSFKVERAFATLFGKTRSMQSAASITIPHREGLWANCANPSVQLENVIVKEKDQQSAAQMVYDTNPKLTLNMRSSGEMYIKAKQTDR
jgi:hypothetical protein